jgi:hypothetical protein
VTKRSTSTLRRACLAVVVAAGSILASGVTGAVTSTTLKAPYVKPATPLTDTTLGTGTVIGGVDMLSNSLGFAMAAPIEKGRGWFYLVETTNLGKSWTVRAPLPTPPFVGIYGWGNEPSIDFVTPKIGYLSLYDGPLWVTDDDGSTWSKVLTPGIDPSYALGTDTMSVVSDLCSAPASESPESCPSDLSQYRVGATSPYRTVRIPAIGVGKWRAGEVLDALSSERVVIQEGRDTPRSSLLSTSDAGAHWRHLDNPCKQLPISQLLITVRGGWQLTCFGDAAMTQGTSELWGSHDAGGAWRIVAQANEEGLDEGDIRDVSNTLYAGGQGVLFAALGGATGGVEVSTDGGSYWTLANIATNLYGGAPETMSTFSARGAVVSVQSDAQFLTLNGATWTQLPTLPAGTYEGLSVCTEATGTKISLGTEEKGIPADVRDYPLVFTNDSDRACYLNGIPVVHSQRDGSRGSVGPAAYSETSNARGGFVILKAQGGRASVALGVQAAHSYPRRYCVPRTMNGLNVRFNSSTFDLRTPNWLVCHDIGMTSIEGIARGVENWV